MDKKNEMPLQAVNEIQKRLATKESFEKRINDIDAQYDKAKDMLLRLTISDGQHEIQNDLFNTLKQITHLAILEVRLHNDTLKELFGEEAPDGN